MQAEAVAPAQARQMVVGESPRMGKLEWLIRCFARNDAPLLIRGESGTGKELVAQEVHRQSARAGHPFVAVNCAAFPDTLLEEELFGHERGAFTGALRRRQGRFEAAEGGTLFLDEISELSLAAQAKLLRVLQERTFEPLGTNETVHFDVRIISATLCDLKDRIARGIFREDLYYRIHALELQVPPLRDRSEDLRLLVDHFLRMFTSPGREVPTLDPATWAALTEYPFPGNVRELEHVLQHAVLLCESRKGRTVFPEDLPSELHRQQRAPVADGQTLPSLKVAVRQFEREYLIHALRANGGRRAATAEKMGLSRKSLWRKLSAYGVTAEEVALESLKLTH